jgi:transcriptional regulator with GAF, ATPase, and Fis domain
LIPSFSTNFLNGKGRVKMDRASQKLENLLELAIILGQQNDFQEALRVIVQHATALFDADIASILVLNPATQHTIKTIMKEGESLEQKRLRHAQSAIAGWVLKNKQPFLSADLETDDRFVEQTVRMSGVRSAICACLQHEDNIIGCLLVLKTSPDGAFDEEALRLLEKTSALAFPFINNVQKIQAYLIRRCRKRRCWRSLRPPVCWAGANDLWSC